METSFLITITRVFFEIFFLTSFILCIFETLAVSKMVPLKFRFEFVGGIIP